VKARRPGKAGVLLATSEAAAVYGEAVTAKGVDALLVDSHGCRAARGPFGKALSLGIERGGDASAPAAVNFFSVAPELRGVEVAQRGLLQSREHIQPLVGVDAGGG